MVYRPELKDETRQIIEDLKTALKKHEEPKRLEAMEEFGEDQELSKISWRRDNKTFDIDYLIRRGLKLQLADYKNKNEGGN